ncbi:MAG: hypothetical protein JXB38_17330 [Anaerolineales bacterium]|nr:hypothetical protein [Anaerolineales bacterium]
MSENKCLHCQRTSEQVPLLALNYKNETLWICPQHLPILIHKPTQLEELFPEAKDWDVTEHDHD